MPPAALSGKPYTRTASPPWCRSPDRRRRTHVDRDTSFSKRVSKRVRSVSVQKKDEISSFVDGPIEKTHRHGDSVVDTELAQVTCIVSRPDRHLFTEAARSVCAELGGSGRRVGKGFDSGCRPELGRIDGEFEKSAHNTRARCLPQPGRAMCAPVPQCRQTEVRGPLHALVDPATIRGGRTQSHSRSARVLAGQGSGRKRKVRGYLHAPGVRGDDWANEPRF